MPPGSSGEIPNRASLILMPVRWEVPATGSTESAFSSDTYVWGASPFIIALVQIAVFSKSHSLPSGYFQNIFAPNIGIPGDALRLAYGHSDRERRRQGKRSICPRKPSGLPDAGRARGRGQSVNE